MRYLAPFALALSLTALAQSSDCDVPSSTRRDAVCLDSRLAALKTAVSTAYQSLRAQLSPKAAALVQSDQREWLHWLHLVCPANSKVRAGDQNRCLLDKYTSREHNLSSVVKVSNAVFFPRTRLLYEAGSRNGTSFPDNDPGFGYSSFSWPQLESRNSKPDASHERWNEAVKERAAELAIGLYTHGRRANFDTAVDASGTIDTFYTIEAANDHFIDTSLICSGFSWGAAHPLTSQISFLWWLDQSRELTISDIFAPHNRWQSRLAVLAISNLRSQKGLEGMLGDDIQQAVREAVSDVNNWTLTRDGLTVTFAQYAVGPYVIGMPEAHIPWNDLRSYLTPQFQPSLLPAPLPKPNR